MTNLPLRERVTGPQHAQREAGRDLAGNVPLLRDRDGWPQMPPPKAAPIEQPSIRRDKGLPALPPERHAQRFTGHPTGNTPVLTKFPRGSLVRSPITENLVEESPVAMQNRMVVYHGIGGPKGTHPDGDYIAPDGHRSRNLAEHLAWVREHITPTPFRDPRSGETFSDSSALLAHQVAMRHKKRPGAFASAKSTK